MTVKQMFAGLLLTVLIINGCEKPEPEAELIRPVRYTQVFKSGGDRVRSFTGVAQSGVESLLSFKVSGTVKRVAVNVGDTVNRGALIAEIDPSDYELQVQQAEASVAQAEAQARNANAGYERVRALYENNNASRSDLDGARAGNESANAGVKTAEKQLELARLQLSYTRLIAPVSGAIASVNSEVNENVQAGYPIVMLSSGSDIEVKLSVPEVLISKIKEGDPVKVSFDAIPGKNYEASITEVGVSAVDAGSTFPVTVRLSKTDNDVRSGMAATVEIMFQATSDKDVCIVPTHAVVEDRFGRFVYIVEPIAGEDGFGTVKRRNVTVGDLTDEGIEVYEGLGDGENLVIAGVSRIHDGLKVRI